MDGPGQGLRLPERLRGPNRQRGIGAMGAARSFACSCCALSLFLPDWQTGSSGRVPAWREPERLRHPASAARREPAAAQRCGARRTRPGNCWRRGHTGGVDGPDRRAGGRSGLQLPVREPERLQSGMHPGWTDGSGLRWPAIGPCLPAQEPGQPTSRCRRAGGQDHSPRVSLRAYTHKLIYHTTPCCVCYLKKSHHVVFCQLLDISPFH